MSRLTENEGFRALRHRTYQLYWLGMLARGTATWMQLVSIPWLAVQVGATPTELGLISGLQFLPTLLLAPLGGVIADRLNRAHVLMATQVGNALQTGALFLLASTGQASVTTVAIFALIFGFLVGMELPVRQAYLTELVPRDDVTSAVSLHSSAWNTTRFVGPGVAGIAIALVGVSVTFALSSALSLLVAASIIAIERARTLATRQVRFVGSILPAILDGARFSWGEPRIRWALAYAAAGGIFGIMVFQTLAPLYVPGQLGLDGGGYGAFMAMWGVGAVVGAYTITLLARGDRLRWLIGGATGIAVVLAALALTSSPPIAFGLAALLGFFQIALSQNALVTVQVAAPDELRGRVMGLYTMVFQGTTPFGAFLAGWLAEVVGVPPAMLITASVLLVIVALTGLALSARRWMVPSRS